MDVNQYLKAREYMDHTRYECKHSLSCICGFDDLIKELNEQLNICSSCKKSVAIDDINGSRICLECAAKRYPLFKGQKLTIENLEGVVVEVECGSHFIVDINGTKKWFNWWRNCYDVQMRSVS